MGIGKPLISSIFTFFLYLLIMKVFSFTFDKSYPLKSYILRLLLSFFTVFIFLFILQSTYRIIHPLDVPSPSVSINTIDNSNPKLKKITYEARAINRTTKDVDVILIFTRIDSDLYPYINLIPKTFSSDRITIKAKESKNFVFTITVDSEDTRLITSHYQKLKVNYIKQKLNGLNNL